MFMFSEVMVGLALYILQDARMSTFDMWSSHNGLSVFLSCPLSDSRTQKKTYIHNDKTYCVFGVVFLM